VIEERSRGKERRRAAREDFRKGQIDGQMYGQRRRARASECEREGESESRGDWERGGTRQREELKVRMNQMRRGSLELE